MQRIHVEITAGIFLIICVLCLAFLSIKMGQDYVMGSNVYSVTATFGNVGGLNKGAPVKIAGVPIGQVQSVKLNNYQAEVTLDIANEVSLREDAIATVKTQGLIGEKFIAISPGGSPDKLKPGENIRDTQSAVNIRDLISRFIFKSDEL